MVIEDDYIHVYLSEEEYAEFIEALEHPPEPNEKMQRLLQDIKKE